VEYWDIPLDFTRLPIQTNFIFDFFHRITAYGGGLGNGKTTAGCVRAFLMSTMFPGNNGFMGRLDGKEFRNTTLREFLRLVPPAMIWRRNDNLGIMKFKNQFGGSEIVYGDFKEERFNNINLGWAFIDQAEEIDGGRFALLVSRLRKETPLIGDDGLPMKDPVGNYLIAKQYAWCTFNPEGTGSFLYEWFHPNSPKRILGRNQTPVQGEDHDYQLYEASTFDAVRAGFIDEDHLAKMLAVFPPDAQKRYLHGSWDVFSGRILPTFAAESHAVSPEDVQRYLRDNQVYIYESIDHGITNPTAVGWWAVDRFGNRILIDEHYEGDGKPVQYHANCIKAHREQIKQPIRTTWLDSACFSLNQSRDDKIYAIVDEYRKEGIYPLPSQKDWDSAYTRVTTGLAFDEHHVNPFTGLIGAPHIYYSAHCTHFEKEALGYRWKKHKITSSNRNAPDEPMDFMDHHMDEWFYFEGSRPAVPVLETETKRDPDWALKRLQELRANYNPLADDESVGTTWMSYGG